MRNTRRFAFLLIAALVSGLLFPSTSLAAVTLKKGSEGGDVWDLQYRLKTLGYYNIPLDGKFGDHTEQAVRRYQRQYGLLPCNHSTLPARPSVDSPAGRPVFYTNLTLPTKRIEESWGAGVAVNNKNTD